MEFGTEGCVDEASLLEKRSFLSSELKGTEGIFHLLMKVSLRMNLHCLHLLLDLLLIIQCASHRKDLSTASTGLMRW